MAPIDVSAPALASGDLRNDAEPIKVRQCGVDRGCRKASALDQLASGQEPHLLELAVDAQRRTGAVAVRVLAD